MKIVTPFGMAVVAVAVFAVALMSRSEELLAVALAAAGVSLLTYIADLRERVTRTDGSDAVERRFKALEDRLALTEGELDLANNQIERLRAERDFDRQLEAGRGLAARAIAPSE